MKHIVVETDTLTITATKKKRNAYELRINLKFANFQRNWGCFEQGIQALVGQVKKWSSSPSLLFAFARTSGNKVLVTARFFDLGDALASIKELADVASKIFSDPYWDYVPKR
jgi:hypothetical protein